MASPTLNGDFLKHAGAVEESKSGRSSSKIIIRGRVYRIGTEVFRSDYANFYKLIGPTSRISKAFILKIYNEPLGAGNGRIGPSVLEPSGLNSIPSHRNIRVPIKRILTGGRVGEIWTSSVSFKRLFRNGTDRVLNLDDVIRGDNYVKLEKGPIKIIRKGLRIFVRAVARQLVDGLKHLHEYGVTHGNFNGDAIFISGDNHSKKHRVTIDGFHLATRPVESDLCKMLDPSYSETNQLISKFKRENMGYIRYLAPENVYSDNEFSSKEGDMWALGVVLYELITGHLPSFLQSKTDDRVMQNLEKFLTNEGFSNQFKRELEIIGEKTKDINIKLCLDLIKNLICKKEDRFTAEDAQSHPFIERITKKKVSSVKKRPKIKRKSENKSKTTSLLSSLNGLSTIKEMTPEDILREQREEEELEISRRVDLLLDVLMLPPLVRDEALINTITEAVGGLIPIPNEAVLKDSTLYDAFKNEFKEYYRENKSWNEYRKYFNQTYKGLKL